MRLLYDGRVFQFQKAGGINRYFAEVISGLPGDFTPLIVGVNDFGKNVPTHLRLRQPAALRFRPRRVSNAIWKKWSLPRLLKSIDILHPTYYDLAERDLLRGYKGPVVATVHDFTYAIYPHLMEDAGKIIADQKAAIERADAIICVSHSTRDDLAERFGDAVHKSTIIHHGSSFAVQAPIMEEIYQNAPSFVFVGNRVGYKNFSFLLGAFAKACQQNPNIRLRLVGAPLSMEERWQAHLLGVIDRIDVVEFPSETDLIEAYRTSMALLYPSLHEGFGIPPLEAMACRTIPITSNTTSLPEVMGDAGIMLDPLDEEAWVETILDCARGAVDRPALIQRGIDRLKLFSWEKTVSEHLSVYRGVANGDRRR